MGQRILTVTGHVSQVRIEADGRMFIDGFIRDAATGQVIERVREDVTENLTPQQQTAITNLLARAANLMAAKAGD